MSLLTATETKNYEQKIEKARKDRNTPWSEIKKLYDARLIKQVQRAQEDPEKFVDALLVLVGSRGTEYFPIYDAYSDHPELLEALTRFDTPEARRALYTLFRALTEIPKTWAKSAFIRFLRGTGKQKDSKYHGAGTFGVDYGWKAKEVENIAATLVSSYDSHHGATYSSVLMSYRDMYGDICDAANEADDYEVVDINARNYATHVDRDVEFLQTCCNILKERGLGPVPQAKAKKPKKARKVKTFESGDIIKKRHLRDLPLPAHIRIPIHRREGKGSWEDNNHTIELVVTGLDNSGHYYYAVVKPGTRNAYPDSRYKSWGYKDDLEGATYLGPWTGKIAKKKILELKFSWAPANRGYAR